MKMLPVFRARAKLGLAPQLISLVVLVALVAGGLVGLALTNTSRDSMREEIFHSNLAHADLAQARAPCVVVMDISLPGMSGIEATRRIKAIQPAAQVVILTIHEDAPYRAEALAAGASAYVTKRKMQIELIPVLSKLLPKPANRCMTVAAFAGERLL